MLAVTIVKAIMISFLRTDIFFLSYFSAFLFLSLLTVRLTILLLLLVGVSGSSCNIGAPEALPRNLFHDLPVAFIILFLGLFDREATFFGSLLDLLGFYLGFLAFFLGLEFVKATAFRKLHFPQGFRLVRCPGFLQEIPVVQCPRSRQTFGWIELQQFFDQVNCPGCIVVHLCLVTLP
jgi:hypothetical protein